MKARPMLDIDFMESEKQQKNEVGETSNFSSSGFVEAPKFSTTGSRQTAAPNPNTGNYYLDSMDLEELIAREDLYYDVATKKQWKRRVDSLVTVSDWEKSNVLLERRMNQRRAQTRKRLERGAKVAEEALFAPKLTLKRSLSGEIISQSKEVGAMVEGGAVQDDQENLKDYVGEEDKHTSAGPSLHNTMVGSKIQHSLDDFFERPVLIYDDTWATGAEQNLSFAVWDLWSKDASVRAKLSNYAYFRADMHVRISISGTPFHYGRTMLSYQPYPDFNDTLVSYDDMLGAVTPGAAALPGYKTYLSQAPGVSYVDFKQNQPTEMTLPFISYKQVFRLWNNAGTLITNATSFEDFAEAGDLRVVTLNAPAIANEDFDSNVSVNIYAWCTNVELGCITATDIDITAQSKEVGWDNMIGNNNMISGEGTVVSRVMNNLARGNNDEYNEPGPLGTAASAVAGMAASAGDLPGIGMFATATSNAVGKWADWFNRYGFSKPALLEKGQFVKNNPYRNGANLAGNDTLFRIVADPKQELSIDPTVAGGDPVDEMAINYIAARCSFLDTFEWTSSDAANTSILWQSYVSPQMCSLFPEVGVGSYVYQPTAMAFACAPFKFWRGKIKYRFEFVCSKFHRGKVLIKYEPNPAGKTLIDAAPTRTNQQNIIIVDLQETQDITIEVDWAQYRHWGELNLPSIATIPNDVKLSSYSAQAFKFSGVNGFIEVRPINELVQPTDLSTVKCNVYTWCEDLQLAYLAEDNMPDNRGYAVAQSCEVETEETINHTGSSTDKIHLEHFGERINSFRAALKRYHTQFTVMQPGIAGITLFSLKSRAIPEMQLHPNKTGAQPLNNNNVRANPKNLLFYLSPAYLGIRGSMRYRLKYLSDIFVNQPADICLVKLNNTAVTASPTRAVTAPGNLTNINDFYVNTLTGGVHFNPHSNAGVEFEIPFYSNNLFLFSSNYDLGFGINSTDTGLSTNIVKAFDCVYPYRGETSKNVFVVMDSAVGEDFTLMRFLGAPFWTTDA